MQQRRTWKVFSFKDTGRISITRYVKGDHFNLRRKKSRLDKAKVCVWRNLLVLHANAIHGNTHPPSTRPLSMLSRGSKRVLLKLNDHENSLASRYSERAISTYYPVSCCSSFSSSSSFYFSLLRSVIYHSLFIVFFFCVFFFVLPLFVFYFYFLFSFVHYFYSFLSSVICSFCIF